MDATVAGVTTPDGSRTAELEENSNEVNVGQRSGAADTLTSRYR